MCGISGEVRFDGGVADMAAVSAMCDQLQRRGPDGSGVWSQGNVALGHRRLKIVDLSECGAQPMVDNELGLTVPDPKLRKRDDGVWEYTEPDWGELKHVVTGHGPKTEERLALRRRFLDQERWVRDALAA